MSIKQLDDASQAYKKFLDKMVEVDKKYSTSYNQPKINAPESLGLKKLAYDMPTEEEVAAAAQKYYEGDKARDVANVGANTDKSVNNLSGKAEQANAVAVKSIADAEQKRKDDLKSANYATQAKNLVNSSIRTGVFEEINDDADQKITNAATTRDETIAEIDKEISRLNDLKGHRKRIRKARGKQGKISDGRGTPKSRRSDQVQQLGGRKRGAVQKEPCKTTRRKRARRVAKGGGYA